MSGRALEVMGDKPLVVWACGLILTIITIGALSFAVFGLESCGTVAGTVIERKTFENSYQNSESRKSEIAVFEAQLAELDEMLADPNIPAAKRSQLKGQRRALNIQLARAREQLDNIYLK